MQVRNAARVLLAATLLIGHAADGLLAQRKESIVPAQDRYPHASEPIGTVRQVYDGVLPLDAAVNTFRNIDRLFPTRTVPRSASPLPLPPAPAPLTSVSFSSGGTPHDLEEFLSKLKSRRPAAQAWPDRRRKVWRIARQNVD